jgi:hypothetical protein
MLFRLFIFAVLMLDGYSRFEAQRREYSMIELNHRYNEFGQPCYSQIIIWQWDGSAGRHDVVAWWLVEPDKLEKLPQRRGQFWHVDHRDKDASIASSPRSIARPKRRLIPSETTSCLNPKA